MRVDRTLFLLMTAAIAGACREQRPPESPMVVSGATGDPIAPIAASATASASPSCDDQSATPPACEGLTCPALKSTDERGRAFPEHMKPAVAERALRCIAGKGEKERCDATAWYRCQFEALESACPDPTVKAWCASWA